jgi:hypothetical protein
MSPTNRYAAVTIIPGKPCCSAVGELKGARILAADVPKLPLPSCTVGDNCRCRYKKFPDRREDDLGRRSDFGEERAAWYVGTQRRKSRGKRSAD